MSVRSLPQPWPADMAPDLLALRGRAEITSGDALAGVRTFEERAALLQQLKDDIAKRERDMAELEASLAAGTGGGGEAAQEKVDDDEVDSPLRDAKRVKKEEGDKDAELAAV